MEYIAKSEFPTEGAIFSIRLSFCHNVPVWEIQINGVTRYALMIMRHQLLSIIQILEYCARYLSPLCTRKPLMTTVTATNSTAA